MAVTAQDQLVQEQLTFLLQQQFEQMNPNVNPEDYLRWQAHLDEIGKRYADARKTEDDQNAAKGDREYAAKVAENIAKALPVISRGIITATKAFQKGDYIAGSAAIMEICAAAAPVIASLLSATGPEGMAVGALFSIIGQILTLFGPKEPSEISQIEALLTELANERQLETIKAVRDAVLSYAATLIPQAHALSRILARPLKNHDDYRALLGGLDEAGLVLKDFSPHSSVAMFNGWAVLEYLKNETNQDVPKWPQVLGIYCKTYGDLVMATMSITLIAHNDDIRHRLADVAPDNPKSSLSEGDRSTLEKKLIALQSYANVRKKEYEECNATVLKALNILTPAARDRGLFAFLKAPRRGGGPGQGGDVYSATGKGARSDDWTRINVGYGSRGIRFSIGAPKENADALTPKYLIAEVEQWIDNRDAGDIAYVRWEPVSLATTDGYMVSPERFEDVCVLPAVQQDGCFVYVSHPAGHLRRYEPDGANKWKLGPGMPSAKGKPVNVRAVRHPPITLVDDPDQDGILPDSPLLSGDDSRGVIVYAAVQSSSAIYVIYHASNGYVPAPRGWGSYTGIDADPYHLWVFGPTGFACATHASVIKCREGRRAAPAWMMGSADELVGDQSTRGLGDKWLVDGQEVDSRPPLKGMISFSACEDGSLLASAYNRTIDRQEAGDHFVFVATDTPTLYKSVYRADVKAGAIAVETWTKIDGIARQVQKLPIPCWSIFEKLKADLAKPA